MFTIDKTLEIEAPAATVWQVLTDFAAYGQWNPFVPECRCELKPGGAIEMQVQLMAKPQFQRERARLAAVTVWETPKTWCEYTEG